MIQSVAKLHWWFKPIILLGAGILFLSGCQTPVTPIPSPAVQPTHLATVTRVKPTQTIQPTATEALPTLAPTALTVPIKERPAFLKWPMPSYIGTVRIAQYPNTPWTWNFLGLNQGYTCPPFNSSPKNIDLEEYWRDTFIPLEEDMAQVDPHQFGVIACYAANDLPGQNGHEGTDISAPGGTPVFAAAEGKVYKWSLDKQDTLLILKHCVGAEWNTQGACEGGEEWYTTYMHITPDEGILKPYRRIIAGAQIGTVYNQGSLSHLHFEVGVKDRSYENFRNPWGIDSAPWNQCMWHDRTICTQPGTDAEITAITTANQTILLMPGSGDPTLAKAPSQPIKLGFTADGILMLDEQHRLYASPRESLGRDTSNWKLISGDVADFENAGDRIVLMDLENNLFLTSWDDQHSSKQTASDVRRFSISAHRLGYLTNDGELFVIQEPESEPELISKEVSSFQLTDNRIAYTDLTGSLIVNEGSLTDKFEELVPVVLAYQVLPDQFGWIDNEHAFYIQIGSLTAEAVEQATNVSRFQLANHRRWYQLSTGEWYVKVGSIFQPGWQLELGEKDALHLGSIHPVVPDLE